MLDVIDNILLKMEDIFFQRLLAFLWVKTVHHCLPIYFIVMLSKKEQTAKSHFLLRVHTFAWSRLLINWIFVPWNLWWSRSSFFSRKYSTDPPDNDKGHDVLWSIFAILHKVNYRENNCWDVAGICWRA